ncbi:hypothetical protein UFOVP275_54 [uncultured Caudovirales phage]|uniref:Uncharacterized protein n=1 Tax=uncultured Caudovirales phage TaxID=2100421 RepID=A0A6J5LLF7_9CAUD|nr:hypothetical protein UFOVP275_54 [uncultured Caudovirales phage]
MKHTPAPWTVKPTGYTGHASAKYVINSTKGRAVAHIKHSTISPMEANAMLIAAAPEMLDLLKEIYAHGLTFSNNEMVEALIAKATGEQA